MVSKIVIYTTPFCPYCLRAIKLLEAKGVSFTNIGIMGDARLRREMEELSGNYTVPQIFINDRLIGGSDDLMALEQTGELDKILGL